MKLKEDYSFILASKSPRRKELLEQIGITFEAIPAVGEEQADDKDLNAYVQTLATQKAMEITEKVFDTKNNLLVLGSDTIVVCDGHIMGKPADEKEAFEMLSSLSGKTHEVMTGVSLLCVEKNSSNLLWKEEQVVTTKVAVNDLTEEEIKAYIATKDPMDKAGAYGIQGAFAAHIKGIEGDYYSVVGLPVSTVYEMLKKHQIIEEGK